MPTDDTPLPPTPLTPPVIPTKPQNVFIRGIASVRDYLAQPEKSHALAVLLGGLAAKSAYTKLILGVVMAFLGVQLQ